MQIIIFLAALSLDVFVASLACGMDHIRIKLLPAICISATCSVILAISLIIGTFLDGIIDERYTSLLCFLGLLIIGVVKIVENLIKAYIKKHDKIQKSYHFSFTNLNFILSIYNNPVNADMNHNSVMSPLEGFFFALVMSVDGLFGGIGAAFFKMNIVVTVLINFIIGLAAILLGEYLGRKACLKTKKDFGWLSGALFVFLAFQKLIRPL
jgi:putative sporulation protein YtaF